MEFDGPRVWVKGSRGLNTRCLGRYRPHPFKFLVDRRPDTLRRLSGAKYVK